MATTSRLWAATLAAAFLVLCAVHLRTVEAQTLVLEYEFDNANLGLDTSGQGNNGNIVGAVNPVAGIFGAGSTGAHLNEGAITRGALAGYTGLPGFTFSAWVNLQSSNGYEGIISQDAGGCCEHRFLLSPAHQPFINVHQHSDRNLTSAPVVSNGQWTHLVLTGQNVGGSAEGRVYINGAEVAGSPQIFSLMPTSAGFNTYIGRGDGGTSHGINAHFDGVQIYEGALNAQQIANIGGSQWGVDASGNWNTPGSWVGNNPPNAKDATANFYGAISANRNATTTTPVSVGTINLDNASASYNIDGAGGLNLDASSGAANVNVASGSHSISTDVNMRASNLVVNGAGDLHIAGNISGTQLGGLNNLATGSHSFNADSESFTGHVDNAGGTSWLLIGRGRQGWQFDTDGQGAVGDVSQNLGAVAGFAPAAYRDAIVNDILAQSGLELSEVEIRLRRAANTAGTEWQEVRWNGFTDTAFTFDFDSGSGRPVDHEVQASVLGGADSRDGTNTRDTFGANINNGHERVFTWAWGGHGNQQGFSYGSAVGGVNGNDPNTFLWENGTENHAIPYTEIYIRALNGGNNSLIKNDAGTLTLSGINSYLGSTDVNAGTLIFNGTHNNAGDYNIASAATLGGDGTINLAEGASVNVAATPGIVSPGSGYSGVSPANLADIGTLTINASDPLALALDMDGILQIDIIDPMTHDLLNIATGTVNINGTPLTPEDPNPLIDSAFLEINGTQDFSTLSFLQDLNFAVGDRVDLLVAPDGIVGNFENFPENMLVSGPDGLPIFFGNDGVSLFLLAVPEPSSVAIWTLLGLAMAGFGFRKWRQQK